MNWRDRFLTVMRVPATPAAPPGSPPLVFRAAPNYLKLRMIQWAFTQLAAILGLVAAIYFLGAYVSQHVPKYVAWGIYIVEIFGAIALAFEAIIGWLIVRFDFELRWYMLSDRAIRIREGIITVREKTVALANIQNISVRQGPLQRFLGIADVEVITAGGGGGEKTEKHEAGGEPMHVAWFRGVSNAEEIRDLLREGVRRQHDAGLGDPDDVKPPGGEPLREAAAMMLAEARALAKSVTASR